MDASINRAGARLTFALYNPKTYVVDHWVAVEMAEVDGYWTVHELKTCFVQAYPKLAGMRAKTRYRLARKVLRYVGKIERRKR